MEKNTPTIKGIFVKSHIQAVKAKKGEQGVMELEKLFGKPLIYSNNDDVPIHEEVRLIECSLSVLYPGEIPQDKIAFEAGRLHFQNFITTPYAKILFSQFLKNFKLVMMQSPNIAGHIFKGVTFSSIDTGGNSVKIILENNDYPLDHFRGLFQEWMNFSGLEGTVEARQIDNKYEYMMTWK